MKQNSFQSKKNIFVFNAELIGYCSLRALLNQVLNVGCDVFWARIIVWDLFKCAYPCEDVT